MLAIALFGIILPWQVVRRAKPVVTSHSISMTLKHRCKRSRVVCMDNWIHAKARWRENDSALRWCRFPRKSMFV
ncbi:hypothetical protein L210DRAFT_3563723 [Boletus edulis BED1]|uniref:Secreted protein n=1 Tax=Boletus edulis BED1 TaxID=1328754 RepID=A0AAD4BH81_BOLED|nr:hypothetical protein L210DRAFT_3563723 [Boletus edulis BED1]